MENFERSFNVPQPEKPSSKKEAESFSKNEKEVSSKSVEKANEKLLESRRYERDLVVENPEYVGINFDQDLVVDSRNFWSQDRWIQYVREREGAIPDEGQNLIETERAKEIIEKRRGNEAQKLISSENYLNSFEGKLQHVRINPAGECSPLSPSQAIEIKSDGTFDVTISPEFIQQVKLIQEQCPNLDLTLVVPFYSHRRGREKASDVPETKEQIEQYIAICKKITKVLGENIQLEIGNETNVSRKTAAMFADKLQHASHVDSIEYAKFFFEIAKKVKKENPQVRLSIAGVACYDPTYLREVLTEIQRVKKEKGIKISLVDTISFHPYRETPEKGSIEVKHGEFKITNLDYKAQLEEMQKIASEFGVHLNVGEINFPLTDYEQKIKLRKALSLTAEKKVESLIYPAVNVSH